MRAGGEWLENVRMPRILYVVELVLAYNLAFNIYKFSTLSYGLDLSTFSSSVKYLYILISTVVSSEMTILTMVRLSSAHRRFWRLAVKTMIIQSFIVLLNGIVFGNWASNPLIQSEIPLVFVYILCIVILFLPKVRRFYTPPMVRTPEIKRWIPFIAIDRTKEHRHRYIFEYDKEKTDP